MANLPPRPGSPLRMGSVRDDRRHIVDERERDRRAAAPMASRYRSERPERFTERDREYVRPRVDSYVPPGPESRREPDRRDYDDRDRSRRDFDRDRDRRDRDRERARERDRDRSPPRRWSPDRERRLYDRERGPPRRRSPLRRPGPRRDSRSPRRYSRSPPHYERKRTRSRSRGPYRSPAPPPQRAIRLGNHSIAASPRSRSSRSPRRPQYPRDRSPVSPNRRPNNQPPSPHKDEQKSLPTEPLADRLKEEHSTQFISPVLNGELPSVYAPLLHTNAVDTQIEHAPSPRPGLDSAHEVSHPSPKREQEEICSENRLTITQTITITPPQSSSETSQLPRAIALSEANDIKMDVDSPRAPTLTSTQSRGSTPSKPSPNPNDQIRGPPTGPRWNQARSPPRGPRNHLHSRPAAQSSSSSYRPPPRGPRREWGVAPQSYASVTPKSGPSLPVIPPYQKPQSEQDQLEQEISKIQAHRANLGTEHFQYISNSRKALQDLDIATIELHAAENRRRITETQLEMAKTGSLGIDAPPLTDFGEM